MQSLVGSGPCDRGCRFGLRLRLPVRLIILVLDGPDLDAAFQHSSVLHADTLGDHIARQRALAANIQTVRALDVALHLADDHNFAGTDVGGDATVTPNSDAVAGKINGALDSAIDVQRFGAADFTFDDQGAPDCSPLHGHTHGLDRSEVRV